MNVGRWYYLHFSKKKKKKDIYTQKVSCVQDFIWQREDSSQVDYDFEVRGLSTSHCLQPSFSYEIQYVVKSIYESQTPRVWILILHLLCLWPEVKFFPYASVFSSIKWDYKIHTSLDCKN